ncbi:hypothetical protein H2204_003862 [Knufia peltigerae]|uniref:Uncharacterized protein n=1 Tax=Knufia peltigerae TaxID=1002370 RepID=A0AA38Y8I8_9EURO|nr:hypothetical protein H2204_003862 [Knufia peltigerae]
MVKVAENRVVDLDIFPGDPKANKLSEQTQTAVAGKIPQDQAKGISSNTQSAVQALGGTVGGGVKEWLIPLATLSEHLRLLRESVTALEAQYNLPEELWAPAPER